MPGTGWVLTRGEFDVVVGASSRDERLRAVYAVSDTDRDPPVLIDNLIYVRITGFSRARGRRGTRKHGHGAWAGPLLALPTEPYCVYRSGVSSPVAHAARQQSS